MLCPVSHVLNHLILVQPRLVARGGVFLDQFLNSVAIQRCEYESLCVDGRLPVRIFYKARVDLADLIGKISRQIETNLWRNWKDDFGSWVPKSTSEGNTSFLTEADYYG